MTEPDAGRAGGLLNAPVARDDEDVVAFVAAGVDIELGRFVATAGRLMGAFSFMGPFGAEGAFGFPGWVSTSDVTSGASSLDGKSACVEACSVDELVILRICRSLSVGSPQRWNFAITGTCILVNE